MILPQRFITFHRCGKLNPGVSAELERVLIKGCQNQREQRWASATDLRMQLVQISTGGRQPPVYVTPAGSMVSASKPQVAAASPVAPTKIGPAYATPAPGTHGLTQRLAMMAVQLSGRQFASHPGWIGFPSGNSDCAAGAGV